CSVRTRCFPLHGNLSSVPARRPRRLAAFIHLKTFCCRPLRTVSSDYGARQRQLRQSNYLGRRPTPEPRKRCQPLRNGLLFAHGTPGHSSRPILLVAAHDRAATHVLKAMTALGRLRDLLNHGEGNGGRVVSTLRITDFTA